MNEQTVSSLDQDVECSTAVQQLFNFEVDLSFWHIRKAEAKFTDEHDASNLQNTKEKNAVIQVFLRALR